MCVYVYVLRVCMCLSMFCVHVRVRACDACVYVGACDCVYGSCVCAWACMYVCEQVTRQ